MSHDARLVDFDPQIASLLDAELKRQQSTLETVSYTHLTLPTRDLV